MGTGIVESSVRFCIIMRLPFCRTLTKPLLSKMLHTYFADKTRSLLNGDLQASGGEHLIVQPMCDLRGISRFKEESQGFG